MNEIIERLNVALSGRYTLEREIGVGGMAWVYLATDLKHERQVAVKVLKPDLAASLGAERFLKEIRTTAGLQHPHILPLFDSGEADTYLFYVMPYVEGESLREKIKRERQLPIDEAVRIAIAIAHALHAAHERGIVHRDIKPANVLMSGREPLVADFGIAVAVGAASSARSTATGVSIGTPFYMSPEQATGDQEVSRTTDIFSLACVLYEMLVGEPPYTGSTAQAILGKILTGAPISSTGVRKTIPIHVDAALRRALETIPADRFKTAAEFASALSNPSFRHGEWKLGTRRAGEAKWKRSTAAAAALAVFFAGLATWALTRPSVTEPVEQFLLHANAYGTPALLPDGSGAVYSAPNADGQAMLWLRRWTSLTPTPIPGSEGRLVGTPTVSPDGSEVAFHEGGALRVASLAEGTVRTVAEGADCCTRWGGDGYLYYTAAAARNIMRVPVAGGTSEVVTPSTQMDGREGEFHLLDDGDTGLLTVWANPPRIDALRLSTGERVPVTSGLKSYIDNEGRVVFATMQGELMAAEFDTRSLTLVGTPVQVATEILVDLKNYPVYSLSPSGTLAYVNSVAIVANMSPVWVDRAGTVTPINVNLKYDPAGNGPLALSRDGRQVAMSIVDGDRTDIWVMDLVQDQTPRRRLTSRGLTNDRPAWLPDGNTLLFLGRAPGERAMWSQRADGAQAAQPVLENDTNRLLGGEVSSDGRWLVYRQGQDAQELDAGTGASDIYAFDLQAGGEPQGLVTSDFDERTPALSPDGRWLAYVSNRAGQDEVFVRPFPDTDAALVQVSLDGGSEPSWSADGSELFYRDAALDLIAATLDTRTAFQITAQTSLFSTLPFQNSRTTRTYQVHPDGRFLMMLRSDLGEDIVLVQNWTQLVGELLEN